MNKQRRKELYGLIKDLRKASDANDINDCLNTLENLKWEEEMYYNNAPANLQYSSRYTESEEAIEYMSDAVDLLNDALDRDEFKQYVDKAIDLINSAAM